MDLGALASSACSAASPSVTCTVQRSAGYATGADGSRVPLYEPAFLALAQVQELTEADLRHADGLNLQGTARSIYLSGWTSGAVRLRRDGGDLISVPDGDTYLVTRVVEQWPDWCRVVATLQNQSL